MASVTITLATPAVTFLTQITVITIFTTGDQHISLGTSLSVDGSTVLYFARIELRRGIGGLGLSLRLSSTPTEASGLPGPDFSDQMEAEGSLTFVASNGATLVVTGISDSTEPYVWEPVADVRSFADILAGLTDQTLIVTFDDGADAIAPSVSISAPASVSELSTATLTATPSGGVYDSLAYAWEVVSGGGSISGSGASVTYTPPGVTADTQVTVRVTVTASLPPGDDDTAQASRTFTVSLYRPTIALSANPTIVDHAATSALSAAVTNLGQALTYRWSSSIGGTFSAQTVPTTNWTAPSSVTLATLADIAFTATDPDGIETTKVIQVTVRAQTSVPLVLPSYADQTGATGDTVDLVLAAATGGRSPYSYAMAMLPEELGSIGRRIRGRLITPGTPTMTVTVTDANGDTDTETFTWTVTGAAILPPSGINVRMDWGRTFFSRDEADVTGRIRSGIYASRGRTINSAILGRTAAGSMEFRLDNSDGLYDLENTLSPLFGLIEPGILVQLREDGEIMWTGVLDSIPTTYDDSSGEHRAYVTALGIYSTLRDATVAKGSLEPESTIQAFCGLLESIDACGVPDPTASYFQMQRWWELGTLREALRHIEDTEGGFAYEDRLGNIALQAAGHRAAQALSATFTGLPVALAGEIKVTGRPQREIAVKDVHNEVVGFVRQYETLTAETVFERQDAIAIARGGSVPLFADFEGEGAVSELDAPASGTDYTAHVNMDGSGNNRSSLLDVTVELSQFNEIKVVVNYPTVGGAPAELFITKMVVKGSILRRLAPAKVSRRTQASIDKYKLKTLELRDTWILSQANMEARADAILALLDSPETRLQFSFYLDDYATFRSLELSDRIRMKFPSYTDDAFIEHLALNIPLSGVLPVCTIQATVTA